MSTAIAEAWYDMADLPQVQIPRLVVTWGPYRIDVAYLRIRTRLAFVDYERARAGELVELPGKTNLRRWGKAPECWRPFDLKSWRWPGGRAPAPLRRQLEPQMWSSRTRFQAVEDAEAAELAREMERDREAARAAGEPEPRVGKRRELWWLNSSAITYSAPGSISPKEAEGRLMRALAADDARLAAGLGVHGGERSGELPLFVQTQADRGDELVALGWLGGAQDMHREVLRLAANLSAYSLLEIGLQLRPKRTPPTVRKLLIGALGEVWAIANGGTTPGTIERDARLAALQERNRQWRVGQ